MNAADDLTEEQADELLAIASVLLRVVTERAEEFCAHYDLPDPRDRVLVQLNLLEMLLEGLMVVSIIEDERIPVMRTLSHNVQNVLRARRKEKKKYDA